jgi:hypothetical protein
MMVKIQVKVFWVVMQEEHGPPKPSYPTTTLHSHNPEDLNLERAKFISKPISMVSKILVISVGICFTPELASHLSKFGVSHSFSIL